MHLGHYFGVSKQTEVLALSVLGIICTVFDASLLEFNDNLYRIWEMKMDDGRFSQRFEVYFKYFMSTIVLVRTFTIHLYLGCYVILLYPVIFVDRPALVLPWLVISAVKSLLMNIFSLLGGLYVCIVYRFMKYACWEFLLTQVLDHSPSVYMFFLVLSYYRDVKSELQVRLYIAATFEGNRKSRIANFEHFEEDRELMSASTIENMVSHLSPTKFKSRSLDTLLAQMQKDQARDEILNESNYKELGATGIIVNSASPLVTKSFGAFATRRKADLEFRDSEKELRLVQPDESKPLIPSVHRRFKVDNESQLAPVNSLARFVDVSKKATPRTRTLTKPAAIKEPLSKTTTSQMEGSGVEEFYKNRLSFAKSYKDDGYTMAYFDEMYVNNSSSKKEE